MKRILILTMLLFTYGIASAQFESRKDVIAYLCSKAFYDREKEYKVTFKTKEVEVAGYVSKQLQIFVNGKLEGIVNQTDVSINPYEDLVGQIHTASKGMDIDIYFDGPDTNSSLRGKIICTRFFNLPIDTLIPEGFKKQQWLKIKICYRAISFAEMSSTQTSINNLKNNGLPHALSFGYDKYFELNYYENSKKEDGWVKFKWMVWVTPHN